MSVELLKQYNPPAHAFFGPGRKQYINEFVEKNFSNHPFKNDIAEALDAPLAGWAIEDATKVIRRNQQQLGQRSQVARQTAKDSATTASQAALNEAKAAQLLFPVKAKQIQVEGQQQRLNTGVEQTAATRRTGLEVQGRLTEARLTAEAQRYVAQQSAGASKYGSLQSAEASRYGSKVSAEAQRFGSQQQLAGLLGSTRITAQSQQAIQRLQNEGNLRVAQVESRDRQLKTVADFASSRTAAAATILGNASQRRFG